MSKWPKLDYRPIDGETLLDALALSLDELGIGAVNTLCALGITFETATLIVSAGKDSMLRTYEAIREAHARNDARAAAHLVKRGLADER